MVILSGTRIREVQVNTSDELKLIEGTRKCNVFRMLEPSTNRVQYFFGGGFYDKQKQEIMLWKDILRPLNYIIIKISDLLYWKFDEVTLDILCKNGVWISSIVLPKIASKSCAFRYLRFDDERVITYKDDIAIVSLPLIDISVAEINRTTVGYPPEPEVMRCPNPLTVAYTKRNGNIYIGYWDIIEEKFIGKLREYWMTLLDIKL